MFEVLFVCTGNICRSPMAERLLLARVPEAARADVRAVSAGTRAVVGYGMDRAAAHVLQELGGDPEGHVARQLSPDQVRQADLVLAATVAHRDAVIRSEPAAMRRTFTLREFARLGFAVQTVPDGPPTAEQLRRRVLEVAGQRGVQEPAGPGADDIADPYGAPLPVMQACGRQVSEVTDAILRVIGLG